MRDIANKITGSTLTADEFNDIPSEIENAVTDSGQSLATLPTPPDLYQLSKALANSAVAADFYEDDGSANNYDLISIGSRQLPTEYFDGLRVRFLPANSNTGSSTLQVGALAAKTIRKSVSSGYAVLASGDIVADMLIEAQYRLASDDFVLLGNYSATEIKEGVVERATTAEAQAGTDTTRYISPYTLAQTIGGAIFPAGTKMIFHNSAPPAGWVLDASVNDRMLRVVNSTGGGTGGSWTISGLTIGGTTLSISQIPSHSHTIYTNNGSGSGSGPSRYAVGQSTSGYYPNIGSTGGGGSHTHPLSANGAWRPSYTNVIIATKS